MSDNNDCTKKPLPLDMEKWRHIIMDWESGNESQKNYCERTGISFNTFTYVRSKLISSGKPKPVFVPVKINQIENVTHANTEEIIIENPQGYKLHVSSGLSMERLAKIFRLSGW